LYRHGTQAGTAKRIQFNRHGFAKIRRAGDLNINRYRHDPSRWWATGYVEQVYLAHLIPQSQTNVNSNIYWSVSPPLNLEDLSKQDFLELVEGLEAEFQREFTAITVDTAEDRVLLVGLITDGMSDRQFEDGLSELERLVDTAGGKFCKSPDKNGIIPILKQ